MSFLTHIDHRSGDVYEIFLDFNGDFEQALRYVERIGVDPIIYDRLCDIHDGTRHDIEGLLIRKRQRINHSL